jgi:hypothetical protein
MNQIFSVQDQDLAFGIRGANIPHTNILDPFRNVGWNVKLTLTDHPSYTLTQSNGASQYHCSECSEHTLRLLEAECKFLCTHPHHLGDSYFLSSISNVKVYKSCRPMAL